MELLKIRYCFHLDGHRSEIFDVNLDGRSLERVDAVDLDFPAWTALEFMQCPHCPLTAAIQPRCPVAASLAQVIERFEDVVSFAEIDLEVITSIRRVSQHTSAQRGLSSLVGLLYATSGCPYTTFFKPMARFHLPLASEEDTIFRAAGMYLLGQYFLRQEGKESDLELEGLSEIYDNLHQVNVMIANRIRSATRIDSTINAVVLLDTFTNLMPFAIEDQLIKIRHLFDSYLPPSDNI
jgi:hypothetical protein